MSSSSLPSVVVAGCAAGGGGGGGGNVDDGGGGDVWRVGRAQPFKARSLGCALAAQEGHNVALVPFDGAFEGSPSVAALQGVRGGGGAHITGITCF